MRQLRIEHFQSGEPWPPWLLLELDEAWEWALQRFDLGDGSLLEELVAERLELTATAERAMREISSGRRKPDKRRGNARKLSAADEYHGAVMMNHFRQNFRSHKALAEEHANLLGIEPIDFIRDLQRQLREAKQTLADELGVSVDYLEKVARKTPL